MTAPAISLLSRQSAAGTVAALKAVILTAVTFLVGYELCLPVLSEDSPVSVPFLATRMNIPGAFGLSIKEALVLVHAALSAPELVAAVRQRRLPAAAFILLLFFAAAMPAVLLNGALGDFPESIRFGLMAYFVLAVREAVRAGRLDALVVMVTTGLLCSMLINLALTFASPAGRIGLLPVLYGQNGPGGAAGFFVGISAVLYRLIASSTARVLIGATAALGVGVVVLSLSKLGMLMAAAGVAAWLIATILQGSGRRRVLALLFAPAAFATVATYALTAPDEVKQQAQVIWDLKFANSGEGFFDESDRTRMAYYLGTFEIVARHPLGVSYSGIGPALLETETFRRGLLKDEDSLVDVNPHNSFLYYMAANGLLGWLATLLFFFWVLYATWRASRSNGSASVLLFAGCTAVYVVYANTLPSFFNEFSIVAYAAFFMYGPTEPA